MNGVSVGRHSRRELDPGDQSLDLQARIVLGVADRGYKLTEEMGIIAETAPEEIARISPEDGQVTGWLDLAGLRKQLIKPHHADVLNGIAHDPATGHLLVTGKYWPQMFEIKISKK